MTKAREARVMQAKMLPMMIPARRQECLLPVHAQE
jgi:hypothetical protein